MINSKEFRIGNKVNLFIENETQEIEIEKIELNFINNFSITSIKPIPITEEWLLKFGFIKKYWKAKNTHYFELEKIEILLEDTFYKKGVTYYKSNLLFEHYPKYVHQLQNLYFSLTGEELTIINKNE